MTSTTYVAENITNEFFVKSTKVYFHELLMPAPIKYHNVTKWLPFLYSGIEDYFFQVQHKGLIIDGEL